MAIEHKINGFAAAPDQFLAAGMSLFTITSVEAEAPLTNKLVLDAVVQAISMTCAPVILGAVVDGGANHTLRFAVDKADTVVAATLQTALRALADDKVVLTRDAAGAPATYADMTNIAVADFVF